VCDCLSKLALTFCNFYYSPEMEEYFPELAVQWKTLLLGWKSSEEE